MRPRKQTANKQIFTKIMKKSRFVKAPLPLPLLNSPPSTGRSFKPSFFPDLNPCTCIYTHSLCLCSLARLLFSPRYTAPSTPSFPHPRSQIRHITHNLIFLVSVDLILHPLTANLQSVVSATTSWETGRYKWITPNARGRLTWFVQRQPRTWPVDYLSPRD